MISKETYDLILRYNYACREVAMLRQAMFSIVDKTKEPEIKEIAVRLTEETKGNNVRNNAGG